MVGCITHVCLVTLLCQLARVASLELTIGLILPYNTSYPYSIRRVRPAVDIAINTVTAPDGILGDYNVTFKIIEKDSQFSEFHAPLAAIDIYKQVNMFLGPVYGFGVAPIARYSSYWGLPLLTSGAPEVKLKNKEEFKFLTRIGATYTESFEILRLMNMKYDWNRFGLVYHKDDSGVNECYMKMWAGYEMLKAHYKEDPTFPRVWTFNEDKERVNATEILRQANESLRCK